MPAPQRSAARPASSGAPTMPLDPPTTRHPDDHLCDSAPGVGQREVGDVEHREPATAADDRDPDVDDA